VRQLEPYFVVVVVCSGMGGLWVPVGAGAGVPYMGMRGKRRKGVAGGTVLEYIGLRRVKFTMEVQVQRVSFVGYTGGRVAVLVCGTYKTYTLYLDRECSSMCRVIQGAGPCHRGHYH